MRLSDEEKEELTRGLLSYYEPICEACGQATYPAAWCNCDPRLQLAKYQHEDAVILMQEEPGEV